jgi:hypothetical protein
MADGSQQPKDSRGQTETADMRWIPIPMSMRSASAVRLSASSGLLRSVATQSTTCKYKLNQFTSHEIGLSSLGIKCYRITIKSRTHLFADVRDV